ncbi:MAG: Hydrolase, TatD family [Parcubacteria group bacterium GW2011_GWA2_43_13]|nr:MAG: Hydrolase, TatD family [Parcubacteria group bacterium GW2011_GWA2_43_13]OGY69231.1 MAG: hypothetical protein A3B94_01720 [Candidatus Jacksonbacteria bacterium RIFCSPHIGHO2_02_FULL_43_10]OGY70384.1 MAG: hypothetical protein A2986_00305 [Candidatus Jacksonbacteria bacterium RIFCSPLOWO2_01_FULL_44_13]HAZ16576.1 hypothetical protein [Candidatus Jacksonbacteria bacterium]
MRIIDTHCHLNFKVFRDTYRETIERALAKDMGLIIIGAAKDTSERAVMIAHEYTNDPVYVAVGQHPSHVGDEPFDGDWLTSLAQDNKVVGIGETGIDLYRPEEIASHELQKEFLTGHVHVARALDKPLIIHSRGTAETLPTAIEDVLGVLRGGMAVRAVFHCFTGTAKQAQQILSTGCMISFTGVITFAKELEATVKAVSLDRLMVETDSPYLAPARYRGKQNEPLYVEEVALKVAEIHGKEYDEVLEQTTQNAIEFFGL